MDSWIFLGREELLEIIEHIDKSGRNYIWMKCGEFEPHLHPKDPSGEKTRTARLTKEFRNPRLNAAATPEEIQKYGLE